MHLNVEHFEKWKKHAQKGLSSAYYIIIGG